jgi:dolichol-phosphate mannosyltransferase
MVQIYVLLPAYNEEHSLPILLDNISSTLDDYKVIIVDDGSTDNTMQIAQEYSSKLPLIILNHNQNLGLGNALKTGIRYAIENSDSSSVLVTMDADLTHDSSQIQSFLSEVENGYDVVIASRYIRGAKQIGVPLTRRILSTILNKMIKFKGSSINDNSSGFRCFRIEILRDAFEEYGTDFITNTGFPANAEILLKLLKFNVRVKEIPILLDYSRKHGPSKLQIWSTIRSYLKLLYGSRSHYEKRCE